MLDFCAFVRCGYTSDSGRACGSVIVTGGGSILLWMGVVFLALSTMSVRLLTMWLLAKAVIPSVGNGISSLKKWRKVL